MYIRLVIASADYLVYLGIASFNPGRSGYYVVVQRGVQELVKHAVCDTSNLVRIGDTAVEVGLRLTAQKQGVQIVVPHTHVNDSRTEVRGLKEFAPTSPS